MDKRQYKDIALFKSPKGRFLGFHARNLELAELTESHWAGEADTDLLNWNNEVSESVRDAQLSRSLTHLSLNVAQICNLRCDYCAAGGDGTYGSPEKKLDIEPAMKMIAKLLSNRGERFHIHFLGGEPLIYPKVVRELCQYAKLMTCGTGRRIEFSVTTNGTLINAAVAELLAEFQFSVTVSLDGPKDINDRTRPSAGSRSSTDATLSGLRNLATVRGKLADVKVNCVFGSHNLEVVRAWEFLRGLGADWTEYNFNFANNEKDVASSDEYLRQMDAVAEAAYAAGGIEELTRIAQYARPLSRIAAQTRIHDYCGAGKTLVQMDTRGDLYTCNWLMNDAAEKIGTPESFTEASTGSTMIDSNDCGKCWARHLCGGGCMAVNKAYSGSKHGKDPLFCERTRHLAATAIHHYVEAFL